MQSDSICWWPIWLIPSTPMTMQYLCLCLGGVWSHVNSRKPLKGNLLGVSISKSLRTVISMIMEIAICLKNPMINMWMKSYFCSLSPAVIGMGLPAVLLYRYFRDTWQWQESVMNLPNTKPEVLCAVMLNLFSHLTSPSQKTTKPTHKRTARHNKYQPSKPISAKPWYSLLLFGLHNINLISMACNKMVLQEPITH